MALYGTVRHCSNLSVSDQPNLPNLIHHNCLHIFLVLAHQSKSLQAINVFIETIGRCELGLLVFIVIIEWLSSSGLHLQYPAC